MEVGDLVQLAGEANAWIGIIIEKCKIPGGSWNEDWFKMTILFPCGHIGWEYDIDLEVIIESR